MDRLVQFISFQYPDTIRLLIRDKEYTYVTSEYWARRAMRQLGYGEGWRAVKILRERGKVINGECNS